MTNIYFRRVEFPNLFSGDIEMNRVAFSIFGFEIYWYALIIAVGLVLAVIYCTFRGRKVAITDDDVFDVALIGGIVGFLGARVYYVVFWNLNPENTYKYDFITTFTTIHDGGLAIYGGIIMGVLTAFFVCRSKGVSFLPMADLGGTGFLIGQAVGRWGNFVNQEAYGAPTAGKLPWGMTGNIIERDAEVIAAQAALPNGEYALVHPCFLYESLWCLLGLLVIHFVLSKIQTFDGELFLYYVIWYGSGRGFIEGLRTDSLYIGGTGIRVSQLLGFASAIFCVIVLIYAKIAVKKSASYVMWRNTDKAKQRYEKYYADLKVQAETEKALKAMKAAKKEAELKAIEKSASIFGDEDDIPEEPENNENDSKGE